METKSKTVLDEEVFPIMGWPGPSGELIRDDVMRDMAEAGFNISLSHPAPGKRLEALDIAHRNGIRLVLQDPAYHVGEGFSLTAERQKQIEQVVEEVKGHPGLYGYFLCDEPKVALFPTLGEVKAVIEALDPYHLKYLNQPTPTANGWDAGSMELFWQDYIRTVKPQFLSYDLYTITVVTQAELDSRDPAAPTYFPAEKIRVGRRGVGYFGGEGFFDSLDMCRNFALFSGLPFWVFTCSIRHGWYPTATEGHIRWQLMHSLAYGAKGLQYFEYVDGGLIDRKGERTDTWYIARKVNREIHNWAPLLRRLKSIAVYHTGPVWSGTRKLIAEVWRPHLLVVDCDGDPVTVGFFRDSENVRYFLVVNKNPCDWARIGLKVNLKEGEDVYEVSPSTGTAEKPWPYNRERLELVFAPGEGRLLKASEKT